MCYSPRSSPIITSTIVSMRGRWNGPLKVEPLQAGSVGLPSRSRQVYTPPLTGVHAVIEPEPDAAVKLGLYPFAAVRKLCSVHGKNLLKKIVSILRYLQCNSRERNFQ